MYCAVSGIGPLALKVNTMASVLAQIKDLLYSLQSSSLFATTNTAVGSESPSQGHDESNSLASLPCVALYRAALQNFYTDDEAREREQLEGMSLSPQ